MPGVAAGSGACVVLIDETGPVRYYSDECWQGRPDECTGVANPDAPTKHKRACHGDTHVARF